MSAENPKTAKMPLLAGLSHSRDATGKETVVPAAEASLTSNTPISAWDMQLKKIGPYQIIKVLGFGGVGTVFEAMDTHIHRKVALKVLNRKWTKDEVAKARFIREAKLSAMIKSPHVAMIHTVGEDDGVPYLAMELLSGFSLEQFRKESNLTMQQVIRLAREMAKGLAAAHSQNLIHRDIKPANIWLETLPDSSGGDKKMYRVKILDFGLARLEEQNEGLTRFGVVLGTPSYMSPEQFNGSRVDARSDLFSLGVVLYQLCTGSLPFQGNDVGEIWDAISRLNPVSAREMNAEVPDKFSRLIDRLLSKMPQHRPPDAINVVRLVENIEQEEERRLMKQTARKLPQQAVPPGSATESPPAKVSSDILPLFKIMLIASLITNLVLMIGMGMLIYLLLTRQ
ncbi:MAG TPA: serine/threonine-protein kinase [Gemmatales bacterium]|nr:serine/threonine-protein kinase [Gemmatales bacterium]